MKQKIYLETTMFNFPFVPDKPGYTELKADTGKVFALIKEGKYEPYTSLYALEELKDTEQMERRENMLNLVDEYGITILPADSRAEQLAALYIAEGAVPPGYPEDATHIATTALYELDFIVSLNFEHIAREWTLRKVDTVNIREGLKRIGIYRPSEVLKL
ncbi:MAG: hypothetical protein LBT00_13090 [Spirochaetaceae bacterium]|nr:hypothetical protein [Spirochaetaceae bacterium]